MGIIVEIRAAEGGEHSRRLVLDQVAIYAKLALRHGLELTVLDQHVGSVVMRVTGDGAAFVFGNESGGHRWQAISGNRVHTSTSTVATLAEPPDTQFVLKPEHLDIRTCRGSGAGGQHRNVTDSAVQVTHKPSGLMVRCETERSQLQNRVSAIALLRARLWEAEREKARAARAADRKTQVGVGARGDKRRTIAVQRDEVVDHVTGRRWRLREYLAGNW